MTTSTVLAEVLRRNNLHRYGVFRLRYEQVARKLDGSLAAGSPSRAQWNRWVTGDIKRLPYVHHCRVLEEMLPGWRADELFAPLTETTDLGVLPRGRGNQKRDGHRRGFPRQLAGPDGERADLLAVFASRTNFAAAFTPIDLFDGARQIRASGLSLNMICQHYADESLRRVIEGGASLHCLFLDPDGDAMKAREREEGISAGHLSTLTAINIDLLDRLRRSLAEEHAERVQLGVYDETIRFNVILIDSDLCVAQPYLPAVRGVDSPTFVMRRADSRHGLYEAFERMFRWNAERSRAV